MSKQQSTDRDNLVRYSTKIQANIKRILKRRKITVYMLANMTKIGEATLSYQFSNRTKNRGKNFSVGMLVAIMVALGEPTEEYFRGIKISLDKPK